MKKKMDLSWTGKGKLCRGRSAQNSPGTARQSQFNLATPVCVSRVLFCFFFNTLVEIASLTLSLSLGVFGKQSG